MPPRGPALPPQHRVPAQLGQPTAHVDEPDQDQQRAHRDQHDQSEMAVHVRSLVVWPSTSAPLFEVFPSPGRCPQIRAGQAGGRFRRGIVVRVGHR
ncbi:hypothetical protein [Fodinicola feengrottensis]|uniref:hypothetical protein n=1 Tax=Fodinicola feengrottensis TaxID=435914 RepID=UPI0013D25701|nr:hypothetical protein [Fodinicola feengrottensis]